MFISLLKYTNIGELITAFLSNVIAKSSFTGVLSLMLLFVISMVSTLFLPSLTSRWQIMAPTVVPAMMTTGFTPEVIQLVFTVGSSVAYILTPAMAYYVIYVSYIEKYNKEGTGLKKSLTYLLPYSLGIMIMWIVLIVLFYIIRLNIGISTGMLL